MKIIQVMPEFKIGGAEIMCQNLIYALSEMGHTVTVISLFDSHTTITERLEEKGINIIYLDKKPGIDISVIKKLRKIFKVEKPDVIHTHLYSLKYAVSAALFIKKVRIFHTVHSIAEKESDKLSRKLNKLFFKFCNVIPVALSSLIKQTVIDEYKLKDRNVPVVFSGIDLSSCIPKEDYSASCEFKILHIGRFAAPKNHIGLLEGFKLFHLKHPDSKLQLIGDGEKRAEIEAFITENELNDCVELLGFKDSVFEYLHNADIFTLPSLYEGIPMTIIEAMGTGLPIVAANVGGIPDMLTNGENAILTKTVPSQLAENFSKLAENQELRTAMGKKALAESLRFSSAEMAKNYLQLYKNGVLTYE